MGKKYKDKQKHNEEKEEDVNKGKKAHDKGAAGRTLKDKEEHINKSKDKAEKKAAELQGKEKVPRSLDVRRNRSKKDRTSAMIRTSKRLPQRSRRNRRRPPHRAQLRHQRW